jgi:hypothetical protein
MKQKFFNYVCLFFIYFKVFAHMLLVSVWKFDNYSLNLFDDESPESSKLLFQKI